MITVSKSDLKSQILEYLRRVQEDGEELVVTDNHVPVLKIVPLPHDPIAEAFADLRGKMTYQGDLLEAETDAWGDI